MRGQSRLFHLPRDPTQIHLRKADSGSWRVRGFVGFGVRTDAYKQTGVSSEDNIIDGGMRSGFTKGIEKLVRGWDKAE